MNSMYKEDRVSQSTSTYLPSPTVTTGDSGALARSRSLVHDLRRRMRRLLGIHIARTVGPWGRQTVRVLRWPLNMWMNGSHAGRRRILSSGRRSVWVVCGGRRI